MQTGGRGAWEVAYKIMSPVCLAVFSKRPFSLSAPVNNRSCPNIKKNSQGLLRLDIRIWSGVRRCYAPWSAFGLSSRELLYGNATYRQELGVAPRNTWQRAVSHRPQRG
jgi:hypothetical protein